ncbi:hypothetical protein PIB30_043272 [Stylosanthes scabra]|uniref:Uncharacterized protein n=1 Tax=Stylosanthes scabra TaxID=79078 RepID=A0ABU6VDD8_9FABA|nr:hypothetical protein [Stylosanthes scabra]
MDKWVGPTNLAHFEQRLYFDIKPTISQVIQSNSHPARDIHASRQPSTLKSCVSGTVSQNSKRPAFSSTEPQRSTRTKRFSSRFEHEEEELNKNRRINNLRNGKDLQPNSKNHLRRTQQLKKSRKEAKGKNSIKSKKQESLKKKDVTPLMPMLMRSPFTQLDSADLKIK